MHASGFFTVNRLPMITLVPRNKLYSNLSMQIIQLIPSLDVLDGKKLGYFGKNTITKGLVW